MNNKIPTAGDAWESGEVCLAMEFDKLREVIAGILSVDPKEITEETTFLEDLGADSLDLFELVTNLEDEYEIEIPSEELEKLTTVGAVADYLKSKGIEE